MHTPDSVSMILDLRDARAEAMVRRVQSTDALTAAETANALGMRFVILAGQLQRKDQGAVCVMLAGDDLTTLATAAVAVMERLAAKGHQATSVHIVGGPEMTQAVSAALERHAGVVERGRLH